MSIAQIVNTFNATTLVTGEELKSLLNKMVEENKTVRVVDSETKVVLLVNPDDLMPQGYRLTGVCPVNKDSEHPAGRFTFAMFGTCGFVTGSNDPFEILKEVEALKAQCEGNNKVQFSKGLEIKISKDLVKLAEKAFKKHQKKALILFSKEDVDYIQEKAEQKLKIYGRDESFFVTSEGDEYYGIVFDGTFCKAVVKAVDEIADSAIDIAITVKTAMMSMVVAANKARDDIKRVIKSIKK